MVPSFVMIKNSRETYLFIILTDLYSFSIKFIHSHCNPPPHMVYCIVYIVTKSEVFLYETD